MAKLFPVGIFLILLLLYCKAKAFNDSVYIRVHFLHGSKPKKEFRKTEQRWQGGILGGGHVGIEYKPGKILNFHIHGRIHVLRNPWMINSQYSVHSINGFYRLEDSMTTPLKKTIISIKISRSQQLKLDSIAKAYLEKTPYDYAFFGMRCASAAYEVLAQIHVVTPMSKGKIRRRMFYPRIFRRYLEKEALEKGYKVRKTKGSEKRIWEKD